MQTTSQSTRDASRPGYATAAEEMKRTTGSLDARLSQVSDLQPSGIVRFTAPAFSAERFVIPFLPELKQRTQRSRFT
jgi:hypothetical protein